MNTAPEVPPTPVPRLASRLVARHYRMVVGALVSLGFGALRAAFYPNVAGQQWPVANRLGLTILVMLGLGQLLVQRQPLLSRSLGAVVVGLVGFTVVGRLMDWGAVPPGWTLDPVFVVAAIALGLGLTQLSRPDVRSLQRAAVLAACGWSVGLVIALAYLHGGWAEPGSVAQRVSLSSGVAFFFLGLGQIALLALEPWFGWFFGAGMAPNLLRLAAATAVAGMMAASLARSMFRDAAAGSVRESLGLTINLLIVLALLWAFSRQLERIEREKTAISAQNQREEALVRSFIDANVVGVAMLAADGRVLRANDAFLMLLGGHRSQLGALVAPEWLPSAESSDPEVRRAAQELAADGHCRPYRRDLLRADGSHLPVLWALASPLDADVRVAFAVDQTERHELELAMRTANAELEQRVQRRTAELHQLNTSLLADNVARKQAEAGALAAQRFAEEANRAKDQFLANVSHEIRTPMNVIVGMSEMLWQTRLDDEQRRYVRTFRDAGDHLLQLLDDLLDLSRMNAGRLTLETGDVDLRVLCERVIDLLAPRAHRKRLELVLDFEPGVAQWVKADAHRLRQVLVNLLGNAIKFTKTGEVVLLVRRGGVGQVRFLVIDTGPGIAPEMHEAIFDSFRQVDATLTRQHGGSGLGLAICRHLVELMGGTLTVQSQPGQGSTFAIEVALPPVRHRSSALVVSESGVHKLLAELPGPVVLVDPSDAVRQALRHLLRGVNLRLLEARGLQDGREVLVALQQRAEVPGLLIVSSRLEDGSSLELLQSSFDRWGTSVATVVLRRDDDTDPLADWSRLGVRATLRKPVLRSVLHDAISQALNGRVRVGGTRRAVTPTRSRAPMLRVLLVDDADDNRMVVQAFLKHLPWRIDTAVNGAEGVRMATQSSYDVVLMDVQMPDVDGYTATRQIRDWELQHGREPVAILALTAHAADETRVLAAAAGCQDWLTKPLKQQDLIQAILSAVSRESAQAQAQPDAGEVVQVDPALQSLVPGYLANRRDEVERMTKAVEAGDWDQIRVAGHGMKGSGGSYGFQRITELGSGLERAAASQDAETCARLLHDLNGYLLSVRVEAAPRRQPPS